MTDWSIGEILNLLLRKLSGKSILVLIAVPIGRDKKYVHMTKKCDVACEVRCESLKESRYKKEPY